MTTLKISEADLRDLSNLDSETTVKEFVEIPRGDYEVKVVDMKCKEVEPDENHPYTRNRLVINFEILTGDYAGNSVYYTQNFDAVWMLKAAGRFIKTLKTNVDMDASKYVTDGEFDRVKYHEMLQEIYDDITSRGLEYQLSITANPKNEKYNVYSIVQVFDE